MKSPPKTDAPASGLLVLAGATLLASLGVSIATVALPNLAEAFSATVPDVQWVILAYLISVTITIVSAGRIGDLLGHGRVLVAGLALFAVASVFCMVAPSLGMLIAARAVQGVGGAILMALPISIARETVAENRTGSVMGMLGTMSAIGTALGPSLGGMLIAGHGWRAPFLVLTLLAFLVLPLALSIRPPGPNWKNTREKRMDWPGAALLALTLILYALATAGGKAGIASSRGLLLLLAFIALLLFLFAQSRTKAPLVPLSLLRDRTAGAAILMNLLVSTVMMAILVVGPFYLTFALGLKEALVGLVMATGPVTAALAGIPAGHITDRFGAHRVLIAGLVEITLGLACLATLPRLLGTTGYIVSLVILTPGFQLFLAANNTAVMIAAPDGQRGMLSGLLGLSRNLGFMTGASVMTTFFAAAIGPEEIAAVPAQAVEDAFTTTFLLATVLALLSVVIALVLRSGRRIAASGATR